MNNAGYMADGWDQKTWDEIMEVNYTGAVSLAEQVAPVLAEGLSLIPFRRALTFEILPSNRMSHTIFMAIPPAFKQLDYVQSANCRWPCGERVQRAQPVQLPGLAVRGV